MSLRAVANRLGVRMNTVLWHAKSRADLQELMADAIVAGISTQALPADPPQRAEEIVARFRVALLARRDGARVVTGTFAARPGTLRFAELLVASLSRVGSTNARRLGRCGRWSTSRSVWWRRSRRRPSRGGLLSSWLGSWPVVLIRRCLR